MSQETPKISAEELYSQHQRNAEELSKAKDASSRAEEMLEFAGQTASSITMSPFATSPDISSAAGMTNEAFDEARNSSIRESDARKAYDENIEHAQEVDFRSEAVHDATTAGVTLSLPQNGLPEIASHVRPVTNSEQQSR